MKSASVDHVRASRTSLRKKRKPLGFSYFLKIRARDLRFWTLSQAFKEFNGTHHSHRFGFIVNRTRKLGDGGKIIISCGCDAVKIVENLYSQDMQVLSPDRH